MQNVFSPYILESPTLTLPDAAGHLTWLEYKRAFAKNGLCISDGVTFSVVRNPWDWHVSWFHYIKQDVGGKQSGHLLEHTLFQEFSFRDYLSWLNDPTTAKGPQGYLEKQMSDWLIDSRERIVVDDVFRQEQLKHDLSNFILNHQLDITPHSLRINKSERSAYRSYYDRESRKIIANRHKRDISLFDYQF